MNKTRLNESYVIIKNTSGTGITSRKTPISIKYCIFTTNNISYTISLFLLAIIDVINSGSDVPLPIQLYN